ncbi:MAG: shikimate kinase [Acidobacteriota bacterium]|nr:shikimate kinase [Acidobacteriota bacterium]
MENSKQKIVLTGFMGVGKSSVARHLAYLLGCQQIDLDDFIVNQERQEIAQILQSVGERRFRQIETENLRKLLQANDAPILSLGGGTWTIAENRRLIKTYNFTSIWLESSFEHCWQNIKFSKKERPLAKNKTAARFLFAEREKIYCLADWHFIVRPGFTSFDTAKLIAEEVFCKI